MLGAGRPVATVGRLAGVHPGDVPALRAALMPRAPRPRGWRYDAPRNVYTHKATGLRFSGHMVAHYGWEGMRELCAEVVGWRQYVADLPTTYLVHERDALLAKALATRTDDDMRRLTRRWSLWYEETEAVRGGTNGR